MKSMFIVFLAAVLLLASTYAFAGKCCTDKSCKCGCCAADASKCGMDKASSGCKS